VVDENTSMFYTEYFDGKRDSWEILRASYESRPILLQSFFRTGQENTNSECLMQCCENAAEYTYHQVEPRSYIVDGDDVFVTWDGFYQDCSDEFASKRDLQWSIGVSKIIQSPECVLTDGLERVKFEDCTSPVSIVYQGVRAREVLLGYSGGAISRSPSGKRVFYLSVIENIFDINGVGEAAASEVWTIPEGENYSKNPMAVQKFGSIRIAREFLEHSVDDVGTLRLRLNDDGIPTGACRTAYDAGVFCYALEMKDETNIDVIETTEYVTREQLSESCTVESSHYPITTILPPVSTGLEVFWREDSPDETPDMLFFGCYGEINGLGNFTTAFANGTTLETIHGGHPGTILFGPKFVPPQEILGDYIPPGLERPPSDIDSRNRVPGSPAIGVMALFATIMFSLYYKKNNQGRLASQHQSYELVEGYSDLSFLPENPSTTSYIELA
jgi:hypothetical protein